MLDGICRPVCGASGYDLARSIVQFYGFSSAKKMASCVLDKGDGTLRLFNKGASEWVLDIATHVHEADGSVAVLTAQKKEELLKVVTEMASRGLRTLVRFMPGCAHPLAVQSV